mgnify:CR=1 FL=1
MIPILYDPLETQFDSNGIGLLTDTISCIVEEERNGSFELTLQYPQEGRLADYIVEDAIIKQNQTTKTAISYSGSINQESRSVA